MKKLYNFNALFFICAFFTAQAQCPTPSLVTVSPSLLCSPGGVINLNANGGVGNLINWYTVPSGGTVIGTSLSSTNFSLNASTTTTYYAQSAAPAVNDFSYTGTPQTYVVPSGVSQVTIEVWGAEGGGLSLSGNVASGDGGKGGYAVGTLTVVPGNTLNVYVGEAGQSSTSGNAAGGWNGGGQGYASSSFEPGNGGGGASDVRLTGNALADRVIVAGGGGGGGEDFGDSFGHGGGLTGVGYAAYDATQLAAGSGGALGIGGGTNFGDGGGGGGGYYGGGTLSSGSIGIDTQGGGGGSGYIGGVQSGTLIDGSLSMPNPIGSGSITGNSGNGFVRITGVGCVSATRVPVVVTVNPPTPSISASNSLICAGSSVTLTTNAVSNFTWSQGSISSLIVVSPTVNTTYSILATGAPSCSASSSVSIVVNSAANTLSIANTSAISGGVCVGKSATLTASGANTYTWTGGVTNAVSFTPAATSGYTVLGTNACGTKSAVTSVSVIALPAIGGSASSPTVCSGGSVTLNGSGGISYTWSPTVTNGSAFVPPVTNNYTVTGTGAAGGCTNNAVVGVTVFISPTVPPIASPTAICIGSSSTLSALGAIGYTWTAPSGPALTGSVVVVSPTTLTTYTLSRLNSTCPSTATLSVVVNNLPVVFASGSPTLVCSGSATTLNAVGAITYSWYPGGPFPGSNVVLYPISSTNYTVVASNGNCTNSAVVPIATNPNPTINIVPSTTLLCQGGSNTVTLTASGAQSYTWQTTPNLFTPAVSVAPLVPTLYTVIGSNSFNCTSSQQQLVLVTPSPSLAVVSSASYICTSGSAVLTAYDAAIPGTPGTGPVNYQWNTGATTPSIGVSPSVSTNYTVTGTYVGSGCQSTTVVILPVFIATFAVTGSSTVCQGSTVDIIASGAAANYLWNTGATTNSISVSPSVPTTYSVTGSTGLCSSTQTVGVIVNPLPPVTATVAKQTICKFEQSVITASGANSYSWAGVPNPVNTAVLTYSAGNNGYSNSTSVFTVTGTDANGCSKSAVVTQLVATCLGIGNLNGNENAQLIHVYPNPNNGQFSIESTVAMQVKVINNLGQVVKTINLSESTKQEINMGNLANGIYLIVGENEGRQITKKIVLNK